MTRLDHERMSPIDTAWLRMDAPANAMMIVGVAATATPLVAADFKRMLERRFLCFRRFRQRPVTDTLGASWVEDDAFKLDFHLKRVTLPKPAGQAELESLAADLASTPLDPARPLWQFHLVERYLGGSAFIMRIHHCYGDGIAMMRVLATMTEQQPAPVRETARGQGSKAAQRNSAGARTARADGNALFEWVGNLSRPAGDLIEQALAEGAQLLESGVHTAFHPDRATQLVMQASGMVGELGRLLALPDDPETPLRGRQSGVKRVAWSRPISLHEIKTVGRALNCTVNDVVMSTLAGALGEQLRAGAVATEDLTLRASVPVNLRSTEVGASLGNQFGLVFVPLPVGARNPLQRLYTTHEAMTALKGSLQPPMTLTLLGMMGLLPKAVQAPAVDLFSRKGSLVASNVPGPRAPIQLCGQRISEMYFWVPQSGVIGLGISILSYAGQVFFGVIADEALLPEPRALVERFAPEFEKLLLAVTVGALALRERAARPAVRKQTKVKARKGKATVRKTPRQDTAATDRASRKSLRDAATATGRSARRPAGGTTPARTAVQ